MKDIVNFETQQSFVTNFQEDELELYQQAILHTKGLYISAEAHDKIGNKLNGYFSLCRTEFAQNDLSDFWACFYCMKMQKKDGVELWMHLPEEIEKRHSKLYKA